MSESPSTDGNKSVEIKAGYVYPYHKFYPPDDSYRWYVVGDITVDSEEKEKEKKPEYGTIKLKDGYLVNIAILIPGEHIEEDFIEDFKEFAQMMGDILARKRHDYGTDNINALGEKGIFVRIFDKVNRLKRLVWEGAERQVKDETIDDTLVDLANYAFIMYRVRKRGAY